MKITLIESLNALLIMTTLTMGGITSAQNIEATATTTTSEGTVSEFGPQGLIIKTAPGSQPIRYISSETTNYVDENGKAVSAKLVTSGLPVTVYYTKVGDTLIASKIMVKTGNVAPVLIVTASPKATSQSTTMTVGTISEFGPQRIVLRTSSSPKPLLYTYTKTTAYVDENGAPVAIETVKSGLPVTVYYSQVGDTLVADKVIVRKTVIVPAPVTETKKTTTTTTTQP